MKNISLKSSVSLDIYSAEETLLREKERIQYTHINKKVKFVSAAVAAAALFVPTSIPSNIGRSQQRPSKGEITTYTYYCINASVS